MSYDLSTAVGQIRLLMGNTDRTDPWLTDAEIEIHYSLEAGNLRRAAAACLDSVAMNEAFTLKVTSLLDLRVDGTAVAKILMDRASKLRELADQADLASTCDVAEMVIDDFSLEEFLYNDALRSQV